MRANRETQAGEEEGSCRDSGGRPRLFPGGEKEKNQAGLLGGVRITDLHLWFIVWNDKQFLQFQRCRKDAPGLPSPARSVEWKEMEKDSNT